MILYCGNCLQKYGTISDNVIKIYQSMNGTCLFRYPLAEN